MWFFGALIALVIFSELIFSNLIYNYFFPLVGTGWAYVVDKSAPLLTVFFMSFFFLRKNWHRSRNFIFSNKVPISALCIIILLVHGLLLRYYFFAEDIYTILGQVNNNNRYFSVSPSINGYPFFPFVLSFLLFNIHALPYNIISLTSFILTALSLYWFIHVISGRKFLAFMTGLFFVTTPSYLDMFSWQGSIQGMSQVLFIGLMSCIFLIYYQKSKNSFFYILSLSFFVSALNMGFVRIAGIIFSLLFLIIFPFFKTMTGIWKRFLQAAPYVVVWIEFVRIRPGTSLFAVPFKILEEKSTSFDFSNYFPPLFYYLDHLFLPATIARYLFPWLKDELFAKFETIQNISFVYAFGLVIFVVLSLLTFIAALRLRSFNGKLVILGLIFIFGNLFYVPLLGSVPKDTTFFDRQFINPAYNPGSRYVFSSAVGVSMLFGLLFAALISLKSKLRYILSAFMLTIIIVNGFISFSAHRRITQSISIPDKIFMDNFFSMVPQDGKKKLVYAVNPIKNMIDVNVGGSNWLYGFYKRDELFYTKDKKEFESLVRLNEYGKENIYAFYTNPETNSFKNISLEVYNKTVGQENKNLQISFLLKAPSMIVSDLSGVNFNRFSRAILESEDLNYRILFEKNLHLKLSHEAIVANDLPYSDIIVDAGNKYPHALWRIISNNYYQPAIFSKKENIPSEFILESFESSSIGELSLEEKQEIVGVLQEREGLVNNIKISSSNINKDNKGVSESALLDGRYASDPAPTSSERVYLSDNSPVTFNIEFPYPIVLGRILLNAPKSHAGNFSPKEADILSSYDDISYESVGSLDDQIESDWSPNNGKMINVLLKPVLSNFLRVTLSNPDSSLLLDEVVIDDYAALKYSPQQIIDYKNRAFLYIDNPDLLKRLISVNSYNYIPLVYACAEDDDWKKQKQDFKTLLPGIWKVEEVDLSENKKILSVNCDGTVLRKIIIFGPPYPSTLKMEEAYLE